MVHKVWDIDSIIQNHNQYALSAMMTTLRTEVAQTPQPKNWSLSVLAEKLRTGPPVLSELLVSFTNVGVMSGFLELIMRYLPGHETDILAERGNARLYRFCRLFGERYFPLPSGSHEQSMDSFVEAMPLDLLGMSYTAYHELDMRPGYILLLSLLVYPYEGDERDGEDDRVPFDPFDPMKHLAEEIASDNYKPTARDIKWLKDLVATLAVGGVWEAPMGFAVAKTSDNGIELREAENTPEVKETIRRTLLIAGILGIKAKFKRTGRTSREKLNGARVALLDRVRQMVGDPVVKLIPPRGWEREHLHRMTDGTLYDGVGDFADWVFGETGCILLDSNYENCAYVEGASQPYFRWSEYNIKILAKQWPRVRQIREKIDNLVEFIEGDPGPRFSEILELLCSQKPAKPNGKKRVENFLDRIAAGIQLEQLDSSEEDEID